MSQHWEVAAFQTSVGLQPHTVALTFVVLLRVVVFEQLSQHWAEEFQKYPTLQPQTVALTLMELELFTAVQFSQQDRSVEFHT